MAWIRWVEEDEVEGPVAEIYARAKGQFSFVPDAVKIFSLRPRVAVAQEALRRSLLGPASSLGARRADLISAVVSGLNHCTYCSVAHAGMLIERGEFVQDEALAMLSDWRALDLPADDRALLAFAEKLNANPSSVEEADVQRLREVGFTDENIYDVVLLTAYRNFMNRVLPGLGVSVDRLRGRFGDALVDLTASI